MPVDTPDANTDLCRSGLPDKPLPEMMAQGFASNAAGLHGSHIGSKKECQAMLQMCADKGKLD